jgi:hypothetical protein
MLRWAILVAAVVSLTAVATLVIQFLPDAEEASKVAVVEVTGPQPKVVVEGDPIYDFGKMPRHDRAEHTWTIKNEGEVPLEVWQDGKTTCSCTAAKLDHGKKTAFDENKKTTMVIQPGDSNTIDLEWHTEKDLGEDYSQGATFGTNDPRTRTFKLTVKGKVYPPVAVVPGGIEFQRGLPNDTPHQRKCFVYSRERPDLKITKISSSRPDLIVGKAKPMGAEELRQLKVERGYEVTVELRPGMPLGIFQDELVIYTDHPKLPELRLPVGGKMDGPISVTPPGLMLHNVVGRDGVTKILKLLVRGGKETRIDVAEKPEKLDVSVEPAGGDGAAKGHYNLKIKVPPGTAPGKVIGQIVLKTDHPMARELKIPVDVLISRSGPG